MSPPFTVCGVVSRATGGNSPKVAELYRLTTLLVSRSITKLEFEWDDAKADANLQSHGVRTLSPPRPMTAAAIERAARADRDAQPLTGTDIKRMRRTPQAKIIRRALELTQEEFAARYRIPLGTLRDWEQGRAEPDQPTRAYLTLIARDPDHVNRILHPKAS